MLLLLGFGRSNAITNGCSHSTAPSCLLLLLGKNKFKILHQTCLKAILFSPASWKLGVQFHGKVQIYGCAFCANKKHKQVVYLFEWRQLKCLDQLAQNARLNLPSNISSELKVLLRTS